MKVVDLTGQKIARLRVLSRSGSNNHGNAMWRCKCDCGEELIVASGHLRDGHTRSCGCLLRETVADLGLTSRLGHGHCSSREHTATYGSWHAMKSRCIHPNHSAYRYYGGRGIRVCDRWLNSFENFLSDMGLRPGGMTLDRIDPDGNYEPKNCRWATVEQQLKNRRKRKLPTGDPGATLTG